MHKFWRWFLVSTGIVTCPCHFPITLPLLIGALGATGLGALLVERSGLIYTAGLAYFVIAVALGAATFRASRQIKAPSDGTERWQSNQRLSPVSQSPPADE
jgi:cytochrome c biogenesis protein CcdA